MIATDAKLEIIPFSHWMTANYTKTFYWFCPELYVRTKRGQISYILLYNMVEKPYTADSPFE